MNNTNKINIIQLNVLNWETNKYSILKELENLEKDLILLNSTGEQNHKKIYIPGFNKYSNNNLEENNAGSAILIKKNLNYRIIETIDKDVLAIEINLEYDKIIIATTYCELAFV